ncbi:MAG: phospholipase D-like domain-containing protein [Candidatus Binataceae bacterium]
MQESIGAVDVRVIVDRSQLNQDRADANAVSRLVAAGIPVLIDSPSGGIAHNKVIIIDGRSVLTGSFNFTTAAENRNVENLIVIRDSMIAEQYEANWRTRAAVSRQLQAGADETGVQPSNTRRPGSPPVGPVVGNRRSQIYEWPSCPGYNAISAKNRVEFSGAAAAESSGFRAARNCR